jgi:hypothetical protein
MYILIYMFLMVNIRVNLSFAAEYLKRILLFLMICPLMWQTSYLNCWSRIHESVWGEEKRMQRNLRDILSSK